MTEPISPEAIDKAKAMFPAKELRTAPSSSNGRRLDGPAYLEHYGRRVVKTVQHGTATLYCLEACVFDESHIGNEAAIGQDQNGKIFYQCFHNSCQGRTWKEAREIISGKDSLAQFITGGEMPSEIHPASGTLTGGAGVSPSPNSKDKNTPLDPMKYLRTGTELQELDVTITWLVEDLVPEVSITTVIGPAGYGKSTVCLNIADAVYRGLLWLGRSTIQRPVYVLDFENPLAVDVERARALNLSGVLFWHTSAEVPPPRIDSPQYEAYKRLPPGLLIVDGHRASQRGDENSSKDTGLVMERWKELRDLGFTIILIHHTQKANEQVFRGSQALIDQADHVLYFYPVRRPGSDDPVEFEDPENMTYFLGTKDKTRFKPCRIYLKRAGEGRFTTAGDPEEEKTELLAGILMDRDELTQTEILRLAKEELDFGKPLTRRLLKRGEEKGFWTKKKGEKNSCLYQLSCCSPLYKGGENRTTEICDFSGKKTTGKNNRAETVGAVELFSCSDAEKNNRKTGEPCIEKDTRFLDGVRVHMKTGMSRAQAEEKTRETFKNMGW